MRLHMFARLHLMGEDHEEAHACYAWGYCSAFDVYAPCLT
jgi:hypothetical protein